MSGARQFRAKHSTRRSPPRGTIIARTFWLVVYPGCHNLVPRALPRMASESPPRDPSELTGAFRFSGQGNGTSVTRGAEVRLISGRAGLAPGSEPRAASAVCQAGCFPRTASASP